MQTNVATNTDAELAALLAEIGAEDDDQTLQGAADQGDVILGSSSDSEIDISVISQAVAAVETREIMAQLSNEDIVVDDAPAGPELLSGDGTVNVMALLNSPAPATEEPPAVTAAATTEEGAPKKKKGRAKKDPSTEGSEKPKREYFGKDKLRRIQHKLGDQLGDYMVLTLSDAALEGEALADAQKATLASIDELGDKTKGRATLFIEFVAGKRSKCNEIAERALKLLAKDGKLTVGDEGICARTCSPVPTR